MPRHRILIYKYGGGEHPIRYGIKTDPNRSVPYTDKTNLQEVASFISAISSRLVLSKDPAYENLSKEEVTSLENARKARLSQLEK